MSTQPLLPKPSTATTTNRSLKTTSASTPPLWRSPITSRPPIRSPLFNRLFLLPTFIIGALSLWAFQACFYPVWAVLQVVGGGGWVEEVYEWAVERSKQGFGMLLILCLQWFAPTTITLSTPTSTTTLPLSSLLTTSASADSSRILLNLPENLIIVSNHQAYLDWILIWIIGYLSVSKTKDDGTGVRNGKGKWRNKGHGSRSLIILLKKSLKKIPLLGWGMTFFRFIFLSRSWLHDRQHLTLALSQLASREKNRPGAGLWLLIFPEGTITSDEEREKSVRFSKREGMPDYVNLLHPRVTGLQFCLKTLLPQIPDLKILDVTIGYPGVTRGGYAQEW